TPPISASSTTGTNSQPAASSGNAFVPSRSMITNAALQRIALASHSFFPGNGLPMSVLPWTWPSATTVPAGMPPVVLMAVPPYGNYAPYGNYSGAAGNASLSTAASPQG